MKLKYISSLAMALTLGCGLTSCEDFLDRPAESEYNGATFYKNDSQCQMGVNYLYSSPWYDIQRGYIKVGEILSGNYYQGQNAYQTLSVSSTDQYLVDMSKSLWAVIGHCNTVYANLMGAPVTSGQQQCIGECLTWKAMAYFYLVRTFGDVPIVHDNVAELAKGDYNSYHKVKREDVYEYIIYTLETAMKYMKGHAGSRGRIDYYAAEGLLAKVYLTKAGVTGTLNQEDLDKAAAYAKDVIDNSGRKLETNYEDVFLLSNAFTPEALISWRWTASGEQWTRQNSFQADLAPSGFDAVQCWGQWDGATYDLERAFGVDFLTASPDQWLNNPDTRLHATMMLPGFKYKQFWTEKQNDDYPLYKDGFDILAFCYTDAADGQWQTPNIAHCAKHLHGSTADHVAATGESDARMASSMPTHILRLSDVYLVYAEAKLGASRNATPDADALEAYNTVYHRAMPLATLPTTYTWEDVWKQRRLELAFEGDRWYDFVRVSYYDYDFCVNELKSQKRGSLSGFSGEGVCKTYFETKVWDASNCSYDDAVDGANLDASNITRIDGSQKYLSLPIIKTDVDFNPNLATKVPAVSVNVRAEYPY